MFCIQCRLKPAVTELTVCCCVSVAKINEETGEDMDDNVYFDECEVDDDDIDEVH